MARGGNSRQVIVVRVGKDCAVAQQTPETTALEQIFKAGQVVVAKLIDNDSEYKANLPGPGLFPGLPLGVGGRSRSPGADKKDAAQKKGEPTAQISRKIDLLFVNFHCRLFTLCRSSSDSIFSGWSGTPISRTWFLTNTHVARHEVSTTSL